MSGMYAPSQPGPHPSRIPFGDGEDARVVAADLSPSWRLLFGQIPDGDFAPFGLLTKAKAIDSALRRGFIERCGYHRDGKWQYRLTDYGQAVATVVRLA